MQDEVPASTVRAAYIRDMRSGTAYPVLRGFAGIVAVPCYAGASVYVGYVASNAGGNGNPPAFYAGLAGSVLLVVGGIAFKEFTTALLDIADATIDTAYVAWTSSDEID